jgi:hypothetical protein
MLNVLKRPELFHRNLNEFNAQKQGFTKITTVTLKPLLAPFKVACRIAKCKNRLSSEEVQCYLLLLI